MKDNTILLLVVEVGIIAFGLAAMVCDQFDIAKMAMVAFVATLGGHLNGTEKQKEEKK